MSRLKFNLLANFAGQAWSVIISVVVIPFYIKFLGIEAYGLLGFYMMLQGVLQALDLGLSPTMNRELARYSAMPEKAGEARDLVRTLEVAYWMLGIVIGGAVIVAAPFFAHRWLNVSTLPSGDVQDALIMMGILVALQWPQSFYGSGLMGLQRQVLVNSIGIPMSAVSNGGAVLVLWLITPKITALLSWQIVVTVIQATLVTFLLWRNLPISGRPPRFSLEIIRKVWKFAAGMSGITLTGIVLSQLDKLILSKLLSLEMFGYYSLASTVGRCLYVLITPVFNAIFPRFSILVAAGDEKGLKELYHRGSQLMTVMVIPLAAVVALFSYDILLLWIGNAETARQTAPIASLLVIGTAVNGLLNLPYALQLAFGSTRISLYINSCFIVILVPAIIIMTTNYGAVGGATVWVVMNVTYMLIGVPLTHKLFLKGEAWRWFRTDVLLPLATTAIVVGIGRWLINSPMSPGVAVAALTGVLLVGALASGVAVPLVRGWMAVQLSKVMTGRA
jgi:O-antigen/teichoic acid export membrane protein